MSERCPECKADRRPLPTWATFHVLFALRGVVWKIVGLGSSCDRVYNPYRHFCYEEVVVVAPVRDATALELPLEGSAVDELGAWARRQRDAQKFYVDELEHALRVAGEPPEPSKGVSPMASSNPPKSEAPPE